MKENLIIKGDNLLVMERLLKNKKIAGKVKLIYTDPPFASDNVFTISDGRASTISRARDGKTAYTDTLDRKEFIEFLRKRVTLMRELLAPDGSIYLHTDYKIGHYVKIMMDEVFGEENFRNDITRIKCNPKNFSRKAYGNEKDMILFYSKGKDIVWNEPRTELTEEDMKRFDKIDPDGRRYTTVPIHAPGESSKGETSKPFKGMLPPKGRHWRVSVKTLEEWDREGLLEWSSTGNPRKKIYADESKGKKMQDVWVFKDPQKPVYPTEKNIKMLEMIIRASSNEGDIVLDPFCGSGTTLEAAEKCGRRWIGIDQSEEANRIERERMSRCRARYECKDVDKSTERIERHSDRNRKKITSKELSIIG